jgi:hypothetical protein
VLLKPTRKSSGLLVTRKAVVAIICEDYEARVELLAAAKQWMLVYPAS